MQLAFVTNNAARTPAAVAAHLTELGVAADADEVVTSAQAAAHVLADRLPAGSRVLVLGDAGLREALIERGLRPVDSADDDPGAVVQGYSPHLGWAELAEGAVAINRGALWVATNLDRTVPSARGPLPGNGSLVAALRHATGRDPDVATGKPDPTMHLESVERTGARNPLIVGDRLDTDIEGAVRAGCASLLVLTGVTGPAELLAAPPGSRPTFLGRDLRSLLTSHPAVEVADGQARCGRWVATWGSDAGRGEERAGSKGVTVRLARSDRSGPEPGAGAGSDDELDALRSLAAASWAVTDASDASDASGATTVTDDLATNHATDANPDLGSDGRDGAGTGDRPGRSIQVAAADPDGRRALSAWGL